MGESRTLVELLDRAAVDDRHGVRLLDRHERETFCPWPTIASAAQRLAAALLAAGVVPGDRVGLAFPTGRPFLVSFFGALVAGAAPVPLAPPARLGQPADTYPRLAAALTVAGVRLLLADRRLCALLESGLGEAAPALGVRAPEELPKVAAVPIRHPAPEDLALVQLSSGTTAAPKAVALTHRAVVAQIESLNALWPMTPGREDRGVSWLPLYHDMGLIGCLGPALERPGTITLLPPEAFLARPALWLRAISRYRASISPAPAFGYARALERIADHELADVDLSCWRLALCGAETIVPQVLRDFAERFADYGFRANALTPVYGLAEATLAVTFTALGRPLRTLVVDRHAMAAEGRAVPAARGRELVSLGVPLPGFAVEIRNPDERKLGEGWVGRVLVSGPSLMEGYLGAPEATAAVLVDGWLDTGDRGFLADGELYITGRAKDLLILAGRNHAPEDVELAAAAVAGVRAGGAVAVSFVPDGATGERLLVLVEAAAASGVAADQVASRVATAVAAATGLIVDTVAVLPPATLPRTSSGKLRRGEALARWLVDELRTLAVAGVAPPGGERRCAAR